MTINFANWMQDNYSTIQNRTLKQICLPGAHDAAMYVAQNCTAYANSCNTVTQSLNMLSMLQAGIRYFDLRPTLHEQKMYCGHYSFEIVGFQGCDGDLLENILRDVATFIASDAKELIVLKFSHYNDVDGGETGFSNQQLITLMSAVSISLARNLFINNTGSRLADIPMSQFIANKSSVLAVFDEVPPDFDRLPTGTYSYADYNPSKPNPTAADLVVYDQFSNLDELVQMWGDQLAKLGTSANHGGDLFLLSWTLTQNASDTISGPCIVDLANRAAEVLNLAVNNQLYDGQITPQLIPNVVYVDIADTFATEACLQLNAQLTPPGQTLETVGAWSDLKPLPGQTNRSGANFQFPVTPPANLTFSMPRGVTCDVMQDKSPGRDPVICTLKNGGSIPQDKLESGTNYYLANPAFAGSPFTVIFQW